MRSSVVDIPGRILVVDDNEMNRDMLSRRLGKKGYAVEVADGGARAMEMIQSSSFDLVLLDIMMPEVDGYEVLAKVRERHGPSDLPIIMATARTESVDVVKALRMGANDYVTKPFDFPVVLARVRTQVALKRSQDALARANRRMKKDLEAAARIQRTLLPAETLTITGGRCAWRYIPCDELAGDTLNVIPLDENTVGLFVLDVSGHGVPASLLSVTLSRLVSDVSARSSVLWADDPDNGQPRIATPVEVAEELSRRFPYDEETHQYFTMVYGTLDTSRRRFACVSAGHTPVVHLRRGGEPVFHGSTGPPVALIPPMLAPSRYGQVEIPLDPGDRLYLMSDGLPEANGPADEEFGMERIAETLRAAQDESLDQSLTTLLEKVWSWGGERAPDDDVSILAIEIEG